MFAIIKNIANIISRIDKTASISKNGKNELNMETTGRSCFISA